jgi:UDP-N-acetylmuramoyl-tripeptide--D-alanyl-D-alanine ligase
VTTVAAIAGLLAIVVTGVRWLRVMQREHYIADSCFTTARRWILRRPLEKVALIPALAGAVVALVAPHRTAAAIGALVAAVCASVFPFGMSLLGRDSRVKMTRRAITLASVVGFLAVAVVGIVSPFGRWYTGPAIAALLMPLLVDIGAWITAPIEARILGRYRDAAAKKLRTIGPKVIAVTGSWGKTSTKRHVADLLRDSVSVLASPASFNNTGGLSLTINNHMSPGCEVFVAEMGMYGPGEIRALTEWIVPDVAIICAVGPMHLERAGSIEAIVAAKSEILERASQAVLWVSNPLLDELAAQQTIRVWRVGWRGTPNLDVEVAVGDDNDTIEVSRSGQVIGTCSRANGVHPENAACAVAAVLAYGLDERAIAAALPTLAGPEHRATIAHTEAGVFVIDDTFNSNPEGAARALDSLVHAIPNGQRAVVTPGFVELGAAQFEENEQFATAVVASDVTLVVVGYTNRRALVQGAGGTATVVVRNRNAARDWVRAQLHSGDGVLWENDLPDYYP